MANSRTSLVWGNEVHVCHKTLTHFMANASRTNIEMLTFTMNIRQVGARTTHKPTEKAIPHSVCSKHCNQTCYAPCIHVAAKCQLWAGLLNLHDMYMYHITSNRHLGIYLLHNTVDPVLNEADVYTCHLCCVVHTIQQAFFFVFSAVSMVFTTEQSLLHNRNMQYEALHVVFTCMWTMCHTSQLVLHLASIWDLVLAICTCSFASRNTVGA